MESLKPVFSVVLVFSFLFFIVTYIQAVGNVTILSTIRITDNTANGPGALGLEGFDRYGSAVADIGDLDGDGVNDLVVGARSDEGTDASSGAVYIHFMNTDGSINSTVKIDENTTNGPGAASLDVGDFYGYSVAGIGDLDGDGVRDIAVGATEDEGGDLSSGAVYIHFMNTDGSIDSTVKLDENTANGPGAANLELSDNYGTAIASLGDLDGDGVIDLAVGAQDDEVTDADEGVIYIHFMNADASIKSTVRITENTTNGPGALDGGDNYGSAIANIGDLDGDGVIDIAVGARYDEGTETDTGAVYIHFMNTDGSIDSTVKIDEDTANGPGATNLDASDLYGVSIANLGDLDGDGVIDIAVGAEADEGTASDSGAVYIHFMNTDGSIDSTVRIVDNTANGPGTDNIDVSDNYGSAVAGIGDLNNDGVRDIAVGALNDGGTNSKSGALYIHFLSVAPDNNGSSVSNVNSGSATLNGTINDTGGDNPTTRGFVYGLTTSYGATTTESGSFSAGSFSANISDLTCGTTYHFSSYAVNNSGTGYGSDQTFTTRGCSSGGGVIYCTEVRTTFCRQRKVKNPIVPLISTSTATGTPVASSSLEQLMSVDATTTISTTSRPIFTTDLYYGYFGPMVKNLQMFLNSQGFLLSTSSYGSPGEETNYFGPLTRSALIRFQDAYGIVPPKGYFGPITRSVVEWITR